MAAQSSGDKSLSFLCNRHDFAELRGGLHSWNGYHGRLSQCVLDEEICAALYYNVTCKHSSWRPSRRDGSQSQTIAEAELPVTFREMASSARLTL
jgi:hypothetical protein